MKTKATWTTFLLALTAWFVLTPVSALITAKFFTVMWSLLLAPQYGPGPTYESWYGISFLVTLGTLHLQWDQKKTDVGPIVGVLGKIISTWIAWGISLAVAAFVRYVLGWP